MPSKFSSVLVKESEQKFDRKENDYIKTKQFFPINVPVEVRIIDAHPSRQFFQGGQPLCRSYDAVTGHSKDEDWKDEIVCETCPHKLEEDRDKRCQYKFVLVLEHEDPDKQYVLTTGYSAQKAFTKYVEDLVLQGLDADLVMTKLTRIENPDGPGTVFVFEQGAALEFPDEGLFYAEQRSMMFKSFFKILHTVLLLLSSSV
jgi:hypothetical protein